MRSAKYTSLLQTFSVSLFTLVMCAISAAQITRPGSPTTNLRPLNNAGTVEGFVYWDANAITHEQTGTCSGLAVVVGAARLPKQPG